MDTENPEINVNYARLLASDLQREFSGVGGFSASNLWRMKAFFETYQGIEKLAPLVRKIGWSHNSFVGMD